VSLSFWLTAAVFVAVPPAYALLIRFLPGAQFLSSWTWAASFGTLSGSAGAWHYGGWGAPAGCAVSLVVALIVRWWRRRKRRSAAALLGEKSRQLRAALVRRARESARPRPVLQPAPRGA
jgi:hypothetical protein